MCEIVESYIKQKKNRDVTINRLQVYVDSRQIEMLIYAFNIANENKM
jgi:hypothetical protein